MRLAVSLSSFHSHLKSEPRETLKKIVNAGFRNVELTALYCDSNKDFGDALSEAGINAVSLHVQLQQLRSRFAQIVANAHYLKVEWLVIPIVQLDEYGSGWARLGEELAGIGHELETHDLRLAFHPNMAEFRPDGDLTGLENLFEGSSRNLEIEFDLAQATKSNQNSIEWLTKLTNRVPLILVDMDKEEANTEHSGYVDWQKTKPVAKSSGIEWLVVTEAKWTGDRFEQLAALHQLFQTDGLLD